MSSHPVRCAQREHTQAHVPNTPRALTQPLPTTSTRGRRGSSAPAGAERGAAAFLETVVKPRRRGGARPSATRRAVRGAASTRAAWSCIVHRSAGDGGAKCAGPLVPKRARERSDLVPGAPARRMFTKGEPLPGKSSSCVLDPPLERASTREHVALARKRQPAPPPQSHIASASAGRRRPWQCIPTASTTVLTPPVAAGAAAPQRGGGALRGRTGERGEKLHDIRSFLWPQRDARRLRRRCTRRRSGGNEAGDARHGRAWQRRAQRSGAERRGAARSACHHALRRVADD